MRLGWERGLTRVHSLDPATVFIRRAGGRPAVHSLLVRLLHLEPLTLDEIFIKAAFSKSFEALLTRPERDLCAPPSGSSCLAAGLRQVKCVFQKLRC